MLIKKTEFMNELRKIIPELPAHIRNLDISVCLNQPVIIKCEFYMSEKLETTTLEIEDASQSDCCN